MKKYAIVKGNQVTHYADTQKEAHGCAAAHGGVVMTRASAAKRKKSGAKKNPRRKGWAIQGDYALDAGGRRWSIAPFAKPRTFAEAKSTVDSFFRSGHAALAVEADVQVWNYDNTSTSYKRSMRGGQWLGPWKRET